MEHRKGGTCEKRFARRTEEQKKDFLKKFGNRIKEEFKTYKLDYIFLEGANIFSEKLRKFPRGF